MAHNFEEERVREINPLDADSGTLALLNKSEIDQQIATAHRYPRSIKRFRDDAVQMVTLTENIAKECIYALPRGGKTIEGPSVRFAEIIVSAWGNSRAGARVVNDQGDYVTAQGVFHDLERNVAITYEVQRRIIDKYGKRYNADMIGITANAACSIALRNAVLKGVPKAFWGEMYSAARKTIAGDVKSLANRRADAIKEFAIFGVSETQILTVLGKAGVQDIGVEDLIALAGFLTAIKDGDSAPEKIFGESVTPPKTLPVYSDEDFQTKLNSWADLILSGKKTADQIIAMVGSKYALTAEQIKSIKGLAGPGDAIDAEVIE